MKSKKKYNQLNRVEDTMVINKMSIGLPESQIPDDLRNNYLNVRISKNDDIQRASVNSKLSKSTIFNDSNHSSTINNNKVKPPNIEFMPKINIYNRLSDQSDNMAKLAKKMDRQNRSKHPSSKIVSINQKDRT